MRSREWLLFPQIRVPPSLAWVPRHHLRLYLYIVLRTERPCPPCWPIALWISVGSVRNDGTRIC
jgi:hypothetical protein